MLDQMMISVGQIGFSNAHWVDLGSYDNEAGVIMQYTGLRDKNGTEIYEGDLLKITNPLLPDPHIIRRVVWHNHSARYAGIPLVHECEVIGNVYSNPELLK